MSFAYLDIKRDETELGRIVVELFVDQLPKTCQNFLQLCSGTKEIDELKLSYKRSPFHRVINHFMIQGGDIVCGDGTGGVSIYANETEKLENKTLGLFEDENLIPLDSLMILAMANSGPNTNTSQFFITTSPAPHLNGKHTVFGRVIHGKSVVREIEKVETTQDDSPKQKIIVIDCGEWYQGDEVPVYNACYDTIGGDIFEEYPEDETSIDEKTLTAYNATTIIKDSATLLFKSGEKQKALLKYKKALRYCNEFVPDRDSEPKYCDLFLDLKKKLFLNLSLTTLNLGDYNESAKYCTYLLEMDDSLKLNLGEKAKTFYRLGLSYRHLKKLDKSFDSFTQAKSFAPDDKLIQLEFTKLEQLLQLHKLKQKSQFSKFFA